MQVHSLFLRLCRRGQSTQEVHVGMSLGEEGIHSLSSPAEQSAVGEGGFQDGPSSLEP